MWNILLQVSLLWPAPTNCRFSFSSSNNSPMLKYFFQVSLSHTIPQCEIYFCKYYLFNYWYNVGSPWEFWCGTEFMVKVVLKHQNPHLELDLNLSEDLLACVVIMSYGGYYDAYPVWSLCYRRSNNSPYIAKRRTSTYLNIAMLARRLAMSQDL